MDPIIILVAHLLIALKGPYNRVSVQFIAHNSMHTTSQYTCVISQFNTYSTCHLHIVHHIQFVTYAQFHDLNISIYHVNLVNIVHNTKYLYKNTSHNMGSKIHQIILHNHIKIIGQK